MDKLEDRNQENQVRIYLAALTVAILLFIPRLTLELALDELGSFWVVKDGIWEAIQRSIKIQGQSPFYYTILWTITQLLGFSSIGLRVFSVTCAFVSSILIFQLGRFLFNRNVGICSLFGFLCCSEVIQSATEARPYALAVTLTLAASISLVQWSKTLTTKSLISYGLFLIATVYVHYLFAIVIIIHAPWIVANVVRASPDKRGHFLKQVFILSLFIFIALAPSTLQLRILASKGAALSIADIPTLLTFIKAILPMDVVVAISLVSAFQLTVWRNTGPLFSRMRCGESNLPIFFVFIWLLLPPLLIYSLSLVSGHSIFIERYYSARVIGTGLLVGVILGAISSSSKRIILLVVLILLTAFGQYAFVSGKRAGDGWTSAIDTIARLDNTKSCPVFLMSGFIESQTVKWLSDDLISDFIRIPATYNKLENRTFLLPYTFDTSDGQSYYSSVVKSEIMKSSCIWLLYRNGELFVNGERLNPSPIFLQSLLLKSGFTSSGLTQFGWVELVFFERSNFQGVHPTS